MKRIIAITVCLMMLLSSVISVSALSGNNSEYAVITDDGFTLGDANGDGAIDMKDSLALRQYCAGVGSADENAGDINGDGKINAKDLLILKKCNALLDSVDNYNDSPYAVDFLTIAGNDISDYCIVYPDGGKYVENAYYSADTLRRYIKDATGIDLPLVAEATGDKVIEFVDVSSVEGLEEELGIESYKYEVSGGNLYIYGTFRGNMYAVNDILENVIGFRFFHDRYTYLYNDRNVDIPEGTNVTYRPGTDFRYTGQNLRSNKTGYYFMRGLNGTQIYSHTDMTYGTLTGPHMINAHSYGYYWKMATGEVDVIFNGTNRNDYAAKYDAGIQQKELEWNPCSTDDLEYATLFRGLLETMRYIQGWHTFRDETSSMSFSICDNPNYFCDCVDCRYISSSGVDKARGERLNAGGAGLNIYLANRACRDVEAFYEGYEEIDGELYWTGRPAGV
ncbi:MAG: dockerin type I repeat-containing protein, partial [Clostridia bacterium]|nr:dockerin type I repeat-containing protein [Clostridia bacterium]